MTSPPSHSPVETQPRTVKVTLASILSFPFRICNPPPAVGKVRSCSVTPLVDVRLQDILDRKHLPPLGLKDFEEWLLYVERAPENLYFTLWLREYTVKYNQWAASYKAQRDKVGDRSNRSVPSSSHLAMFYARAKQTFFMPNSAYELNLPSKFLAPFHASDGSLHPDPLIFTDVAVETQRMLQASLRLFVQAQLNNVGNTRVVCGIVAGILGILTLGVTPLSITFTLSQSRWTRLTAFPGIFLGLVIIFAAFQGICMGVYLFGDLRQLHKFELNRPPISKPRPLSTSHRPKSLSYATSSPPTSLILPITQPPRLSIIPPPPPAHLTDRHRCNSASSFGSQSSRSSGFTHEIPGMGIEISNIMYDAETVDGPATSPIAPESRFMSPQRVQADDGSFTTTATFIHPYDFNDDYDRKPLPEEGQPLSSFDFDALPSLFCRQNPPQYHGLVDIRPKASLPPLKSSTSPRQLLTLFQEKCSIKWRVSPAAVTATIDIEKQTLPQKSGSFRLNAQPPQEVPHLVERKEAAVRQQWKMIKAVPAFTELTRILSPVIVRGQWEVVVRSGMIAFVLTWAIMGGLLAVPPR